MVISYWSLLTVTGIQPHQNLAGLNIPPGTPDEWKFAWSEEWAEVYIGKGFTALEQMLNESQGKYLLRGRPGNAGRCLPSTSSLQRPDAPCRSVSLSQHRQYQQWADEAGSLLLFTTQPATWLGGRRPQIRPQCQLITYFVRQLRCVFDLINFPLCMLVINPQWKWPTFATFSLHHKWNTFESKRMNWHV